MPDARRLWQTAVDLQELLAGGEMDTHEPRCNEATSLRAPDTNYHLIPFDGDARTELRGACSVDVPRTLGWCMPWLSWEGFNNEVDAIL